MRTKMYPVMHLEMPATETRRAQEFYERVFGWQTQPLTPEAGHFVVTFTTESDEHRVPKQRGAINGGFFQRTAPDQQVRLTILVDDIREAMQQIAAAGGTVLGGSQSPGEPDEMPGLGLFAAFIDPEGQSGEHLPGLRPQETA